MIYICATCGYKYDEAKEGVKFSDLPDDWICPVCGDAKQNFIPQEEEEPASSEQPIEHLEREQDTVEENMKMIHQMAKIGKSVGEAMRTRREIKPSWNDILFLGGQLAIRPLEKDIAINSEIVIGKNAKQPLCLKTPIIISHMSFGALSKEAKIALAKGSARVGAGFCSGEGGILEETLAEAFGYIFEYVPNQYGVNDENLKRVGAIEIKFGQSTKPGMGGHLPAHKVSAEIAKARGKPLGEDIVSPSVFSSIITPSDLKNVVEELRERSGGKPVGVKLAAGHIEKDLAFVLEANPDFITLDGRPGGTGSSPKFIKDSTSVPTIFALARARKYLDKAGSSANLIITGGLRTSADFAKALAMGADGVAIATAAMMAIGCQQYKICNTDRCPMGIATQDPILRKRFSIDNSADWLANFLRVSTDEIKDFARICGKNDVNLLSKEDLITTDESLAKYTSIKHAGEAEV